MQDIVSSQILFAHESLLARFTFERFSAFMDKLDVRHETCPPVERFAAMLTRKTILAGMMEDVST